MRAERQENEREIERLKGETRETASKVATLEQENSHFERLFDQMYHEKLELERALQTSNSSKQALKSESKQLQDQLADLHSDLQAVKTELQQAADNQTLLLERNQDLEKDVKAADETVGTLESKVEELQLLLEAKTSSEEACDGQERHWGQLREWMEGQVVDRLSAIERKMDSKSVPIGEFEDLEDRNAQLQQENTHLRTVNDSLSAELQAATERMRTESSSKETKRLKDQLRELEETVYDLKSQLIAANTEKQQILDSQEELYRDKETFRKELQSVQQRVDEEKQTWEQKMRSTKREADNSADRNNEAKARLESLGIELTKARLETMHFQIENSQIMAKLEGFLKQSPDLETRTRNVAAKIERLQQLTEATRPMDTDALLDEGPILSGDEEEVEDLVFGQEERSDLDEKSLSGRLKNVFHTSLSSSFG